MHISKLRLKNFRCFGPDLVEIDLDSLTAFIGANSCGKTSAIQALYKLFGVNDKDRMLLRSDFHVPSGIEPSSLSHIEMVIEAVIAFPELLANEDEVAVRTVPDFFGHMVIEEEGAQPYVRIRLTAEWFRNHTPEGAIETSLEFICSSDLEIPKDDSSRHRCSSIIRSKIQMLYIPAIREPSSQLKYQASSLIGQLFSSVKWTDSTKIEISGKVKELNTFFKEQDSVVQLSKVINKQWKSFHDGEKFNKADINFFGLELDTILKGIEVRFSPTYTESEYAVSQLGDGLQSLFYLSMVTSLLELQDNITIHPHLFESEYELPCLTIIALEEPENHLAPHLLGKTISNFISLSSLSNAQVLFTSHTPSIFKRISPENVRYFRSEVKSHVSRVQRITLPAVKSESFTYVKEAVMAYPELYFSRLIVLGEGDSEEAIIPRILRAYGCDLDAELISVVPLGGRHVNHFWRLLTDLDVPFITLIDLDLERNTGGWQRVKYICEELIERGTLTKEQLGTSGTPIDLEMMGKLSLETAEQKKVFEGWVTFLKQFDVYFSAPLDIDFLMLQSYFDKYKETIIAPNRGPNIPIEVDALNKRISEATTQTLKSETAIGMNYTASEKERFIWYSYFFLGRSKPVTHFEFLSSISDGDLRKGLPPVLEELVQAVCRKLRIDTTNRLSHSVVSKADEELDEDFDERDEEEDMGCDEEVDPDEDEIPF